VRSSWGLTLDPQLGHMNCITLFTHRCANLLGVSPNRLYHKVSSGANMWLAH
jgi:hypothetical protein